MYTDVQIQYIYHTSLQRTGYVLYELYIVIFILNYLNWLHFCFRYILAIHGH